MQHATTRIIVALVALSSRRLNGASLLLSRPLAAAFVPHSTMTPSPSACLSFGRFHRSRSTSPITWYLSANKNDKNSNRNDDSSSSSSGPFDFLFNPYQSKIPKELEQDIYAAEAKTPAAQNRNTRITGYAVLAFLGILAAFFNGFITEMRGSETPDGVPFQLEQAGFGWVEANVVTKFLFMNKIGGGLCLLLGGGAGLLAEAEYDTRRINAEKIFAELKRRKEAKEQDRGAVKNEKSGRKKRRSGKETKRLGALAEIVDTASSSGSSSSSKDEPVENVTSAQEDAGTQAEVKDTTTGKKEDGFLGTVKNFYERADAMAASQALLLNKKLEDAGIVEKITDETGFKVIGKEAAAKINEQSSSADETKKDIE